MNEIEKKKGICSTMKNILSNDNIYNPEYDGKMIYLPEIDMVRPGDIFLTYNNESDDKLGSKQSYLIKKFSRGNFSHALICSTPPTLVEAIGRGVSSISLSRCFIHELKNVKVLRCPNTTVAEAVGKKAHEQIGRPYSVLRAMLSIRPGASPIEMQEGGIFCSALIAFLYKECNSELFSEIPASQTTPATIEQMDGFDDVTEEIFYSTLAPKNIEKFSALDGDRRDSPTLMQTTLFLEFTEKLLPDCQNIKKEFNVNIDFDYTFLGIFQFILKLFKEKPANYATEKDAYNSHVSNLDRKCSSCIEDERLNDIIELTKKMDYDLISYQMTESFKEIPDIDIEQTEKIVKTYKTQLYIREESIKNYISDGPKNSLSLSAYIDWQNKINSNMRSAIIAFEEIIHRVKT